MSDNSSSGPGILGIALAVALGIGIAHDDGWIGNDEPEQPGQSTEISEPQVTAPLPSPQP